VDEAERVRRLRRQGGEPVRVPASVQGLLADDGSIPSWKVQEAIAVWQSARAEVAEVGGFEAAERLLFLTILLGSHYRGLGEPLRQRAMLESALEVFDLPRHAQIVRGQLARSAVRAGELEAAERWLAPCDARSDDLQTDSAYRHARALLDAARRQADAVLATLGATRQDVPLLTEIEPDTTLLRAHAWELRREDHRAVQLLVEGMQRGQRLAMDQARADLAAFALCDRSYPLALRAHREARAEAILDTGAARLLSWMAWGFGGIAAILMGGGALCLIIALISMIAPLVTGGGEAAWLAGGTVAFSLAVTGLSLMAPGGGMALTAAIPGWIARRMKANARREADLVLHGVDAQAEVLELRSTNVSVNEVPRYHVILRFTLEGRQPWEGSVDALLTPAQVRMTQPGRTVPVLVDPDDPQQVRLELEGSSSSS
jgi:hypothetical protein